MRLKSVLLGKMMLGAGADLMKSWSPSILTFSASITRNLHAPCCIGPGQQLGEFLAAKPGEDIGRS